jgi:hypothetical protein
VHNGIVREHKSCDVLVVKLTYVSLFIIFIPLLKMVVLTFFVLFHRMLVTEDLGSNAVGEDRKMYVMGSVHIAVICVTKHSGKHMT